jgi:hypothetical protein
MAAEQFQITHARKVFASLLAYDGSRYVPTKKVHSQRGDYQILPQSPQLIDTGRTRDYGKSRRKIFADIATGTEWVMEPWYLNMFHNPARNIKFICPDDTIIEGALGSSECQIPRNDRRMTDEKIEIYLTAQLKSGSYNFRTRGFAHFFADVLPSIIYCKCIGA